MVNKQRVRRIKNLIYAFIIFVILLPIILMTLLSFEVLKLNREISGKLDNLTTPASQASSPAPDGGYVIDPEGQAAKGETPQPRNLEEKNNVNDTDDQVSTVSGDEKETVGSLPDGTKSESSGSLVNGVSTPEVGEISLIGDASGINGTPYDKSLLNAGSSPGNDSNVNGVNKGNGDPNAGIGNVNSVNNSTGNTNGTGNANGVNNSTGNVNGANKGNDNPDAGGVANNGNASGASGATAGANNRPNGDSATGGINGNPLTGG